MVRSLSSYNRYADTEEGGKIIDRETGRQTDRQIVGWIAQVQPGEGSKAISQKEKV